MVVNTQFHKFYGRSFERVLYLIIEGTFPVYFEGRLRPLFSSLISSSFLKCSRGNEVTVTAHQGQILISSDCDE